VLSGGSVEVFDVFVEAPVISVWFKEVIDEAVVSSSLENFFSLYSIDKRIRVTINCESEFQANHIMNT